MPSLPLAAQSYTAGFPNVNAFVLVNAAGTANRFPPIAGTAPDDGNALTAAEVQALIGNVLSVATVTRAGIRIPTNSNAQISVSVVDLDGNILGIARLPDAPIFGIDVSLQKARSAVFFSRADAASAFHTINAITAPPFPAAPVGGFPAYMAAQSVESVFFNNAAVANAALFSSGKAFSDGAIGNISRPFFPDGQNGNPNGPLEPSPGRVEHLLDRPADRSDQIRSRQPLGRRGAACCGDRVRQRQGGRGHQCLPAGGGNAGLPLPKSQPNNTVTETHTQLANGFQIFSGGFPLYRGNELVGAVGISGDGIFQDALIAYIGIQGDGSIAVAGVSTFGLNNAPDGIRADTIEIQPQSGDGADRPGLYPVPAVALHNLAGRGRLPLNRQSGH